MNISAEIAPDVQTVVWDLDGTLLDSFGIYRDCMNEALHNLGRPEIAEQTYRNHHHGYINDCIADVLAEAGQTYTPQEFDQILGKFFELDNAYIEDVDHHLFEDAVDLAGRIHAAGKRQIVVTNRPHGSDRGNGSPRNLVANSRLKPYMSDVLCGDDGPHRKPHRALLEEYFGAGLSDVGNILVIGDQFVDAEFARNIGGAAILVTRTDKIAHLDRLGDWQEHVTIVPSLADVKA